MEFCCLLTNSNLLLNLFFFLKNFSLQQIGVSSGRASIASCTSLPPAQVFTTIGIFKSERVAIKKVAKKKVTTPFLLLVKVN